MSAPAVAGAVAGAPRAIATAAAPASPSQPARVPAEARRAALLVHALPLADRDWLLRRLPEGERLALGALVAELESLGIPADAALVREVARASDAPTDDASPGTRAQAARADDASGAALEAIERADPAAIAALLRDEPIGLAVRLLAIRAWPWRDEVLRRLGASERRELEERLVRDRVPPGGTAPALHAHLLASLARRLRHPAAARAGVDGKDVGDAHAPADPRRSRARRWLARLWPAGGRP